MIELPHPHATPSHRVAAPYHKQESITLPAPSAAAQAIDAVLQDPALASELRSRGVIGKRPYDAGRGHRWVARRNGNCMKAIGWEISDAGVLRPRECGHPIAEGEECWRRGFYFYGLTGCHDKNVILVPKLFVGEHVVNGTEFANNLPDRRKVLSVIEALWKIEAEAGNITGEWGTEDRRTSEGRACATVLQAMRDLKAGTTKITLPMVYKKPERPKPPRKEAKPKGAVKHVVLPQAPPLNATAKALRDRKEAEAKRAGKDGLVIEKAQPVTSLSTTLKGVVRRFAGTSAKEMAEGFARQFNEARAKSNLRPLEVTPEGTQWVVVNPDLRDQPVTTPNKAEAKIAKAKVAKR